ncbi:MAG: hypothetical protein GX206_05885 [Clostridiales bacterium]|nr:hypothetical protein [Clostridiales bacterium]
MREKVTKFMLLLLVVILAINIGITTKAKETYKVTVKKEVGFDDNYKVGYPTPISLTVKNEGKSIDGEVEIQVPSSLGKYMSYVKKLSLEEGAEKKIVIDVPVNQYRGKYKVVITSGKNKVYEGEVKFRNTNNNITQFIGILSDDYDSLTYINKMPSSNGMTTLTKNIKLTEENFPEDIFTLKAFNLLIINNYDTTKLNKKQYEVLKQWVADGGTLLIGTGANHKKTLGAFKDNFIEGNVGESKQISTSLISEMGTNGDSKTEVNIEITQLTIKGSTAVIQDKGEVLVQKIENGKGCIVIAAFDFGQSPFVGWNNNTNFAETLIMTTNPNIVYMDNIDSKRQQGQFSDFHQLRSIFDSFVEIARANKPTFYLILFIYVLVVAPLNYFILKKLDKRELMWVSVPLISVVFSVIIYITGFGSRLSETTSNTFSIYSMDSKGVSSSFTYAGIYTPNKSRLKIETEDGDKIYPIVDEYYYIDSSSSITNEDLEARIINDGNGGIEFVNSSILQAKLLQIHNKSLNLGKIDANITIKNDDIEGLIINSTNLDLEDCYIITSNKYYELGTMNKGEIKKLGEYLKSDSYGGNIYHLTEMIYGNPYRYSTYSSTSEKLERIDNFQKYLMLNMVMNQIQMISAEKAYFIGISKTPSMKPLIINGKASKTNERSFIIMPIDLNFQQGEYIDYPVGFVPFNVWEDGGLYYNVDIQSLTGSGYTEITYMVNENIDVSAIEIGMPKYATGSSPIKFYIFNNITNFYDELSSYNISGEDVSKYCDKKNQIRLKVVMADGNCDIPQLGVKGKVK